MTFELRMPGKTPSEPVEIFRLEDYRSLVIVGATGAGKTRLGVWLDENNQQVHRISAQRGLGFKTTLPVVSYREAQKAFLYGEDSFGRKADRWDGDPALYSLQDFNAALAMLLAEVVYRDRKYSDEIERRKAYIPRPDSGMDRVLRIWRRLMPQRSLSFDIENASIEAITHSEGNRYFANGMSDGERSVLYLLAQSICVRPNSILLIDEPEAHLHRAIVAPLWDEIENARQDCLFVYLTHDLDFAASRVKTKKLWIKDYQGGFYWEELPKDASVPDELLLKVIGSRRPVLFVEGEIESLDNRIYKTVFPGHLVIPRGGHLKVVEASNALRDLPRLHHLQINGLIDRDYHSDEYLDTLNRKGVYAIGVAEVENLLCTPEIVIAVANHLKLNPDEVFADVQTRVLRTLRQEYQTQVLQRTRAYVEHQMTKKFGGKFSDFTELKAALNSIPSELDPDEVYRDNEALYGAVLEQQDYTGVLKLYNQKGLFATVADALGMKYEGYIDLVLRLLSDPTNGASMVSGLMQYIPSIQD